MLQGMKETGIATSDNQICPSKFNDHGHLATDIIQVVQQHTNITL